MQRGIDFIGVGVGAMIFNERGELLFTLRGQDARNERGCWEIPGGSVEFGEPRHQAVIREIKEEIGVDIFVRRELHALDHFIPHEGQHWVTTPFVCEMAQGQTPYILEPDKCDAWGWFPLDALPSPLALTTELNL